jgi:quercetin dioxygenase-like cupin family protein
MRHELTSITERNHTVKKRAVVPALFAGLLIGLAPAAGAVAQQQAEIGGLDYDRAALYAGQPASAIRQFQTRFEVANAPEQFDQVLQIVDFPAGAWTPLHTPGGNVYNIVIEGAISTRLSWTQGVYETTYEVGQTFVQRPGEYVQVGNPTAGNTRIMSTALLPGRAPLTTYQDGFTSSAYPSLTAWSFTHDIVVSAAGPQVAHRSVVAVNRPSASFELVQLVLETADSQSLNGPDWAQLAALYGVPAKGSTTSDEVGDSCLNVWGRVSTDMQLDVYQHTFERAGGNLCVSTKHVPVPGLGGPITP